MKNSEIATAFIQGIEAKNPNGSFFVENVEGVSVVFSYGYHFPIAISFNDGFLFNSNGYSNTTSRHKNLILREIDDDLTDADFKTTNELIKIVDLIKYNGLRSKAELIEQKI